MIATTMLAMIGRKGSNKHKNGINISTSIIHVKVMHMAGIGPLPQGSNHGLSKRKHPWQTFFGWQR